MLRAGVSFPALMKLLGHTSPEMTMRYLDVVLTDLQREFELARSKPRHLAPQPKASFASLRTGLGGGNRFFARRSTCARDVPPDAPKRHFPPSPRPPLQPPHQNRHR